MKTAHEYIQASPGEDPFDLPKADDVRCGPSDEGLVEIAKVAGELRQLSDDLRASHIPWEARRMDDWSNRILRALGKR